MPQRSLADIPAGCDIFIDANIFIYALNGLSPQCRRLLERCSREEVTGISLLETVNEATHRFMLAEARAKGWISSERAQELRRNFRVIPRLTEYWQATEKILALDLLFLSVTETILRSAQKTRESASLLTNDSMVAACMQEYGLSYLASSDRDFERVSGITIFRPDDLP